MVGAVAPLAPAIGEAAVALALFAAFVVAYGLLAVYRSTLGAIVVWLADHLDGVSIPTGVRRVHVFGPLASALRFVDEQIRDGLALAVLETERGAAWIWNVAADQIAWIGREVGGLALDVEHALDRFRTVTLPRSIAAAQAAAAARLAAVRALAVATAGTVARDLPGLRRDVNIWRGYTRRMLRRLRRLERFAAPAAFAAAVAVALSRLGLNWIRCPALNRISRRHGCAPWRFLELLLLPTVSALTLANICQITKYAEAAAVAAEPQLSRLVAVGENFMCGEDGGEPSGIVAADRNDSGLRPTGIVAADLAARAA